MDLATLPWLLAGAVVAYFLKGFGGFGPAIVFVPAVSSLFDPRTALVSSAMIDLAVGLVLVRALSYERGELRLALRLALRMAAGTIVGASLAGVVPAALLLHIIAVVILVFGLSLVLFHRPIPVGPVVKSTRALDLGCVLGGLTGGLVGISGPFVVFFARPLMEKSQFRRVLVALFLFECVVKLLAYAVAGVWTSAAPVVSAFALPGVALGLVLGFRSHGKVSERLFSAIVGVILLGLAVRLLT